MTGFVPFRELIPFLLCAFFWLCIVKFTTELQGELAMAGKERSNCDTKATATWVFPKRQLSCG